MGKSTEKTKKNSSLPKWAKIVIVAAAAVLIVLGSFFAYAASYSKILPNISVQGLRIGGMTTDMAAEEIQNKFGDISNGRSVIISCGGNERELAFNAFDFSVDAKKSAQTAYEVGRKKGVFGKVLKILQLIFTTENIDVVSNFDKTELNQMVTELSEGKEVPASDTEYILDGNKLTIFKAHGGKMIDRSKAAKNFAKAAIDNSIKEIKLEIETVEAKTPDLEKFYQELTAPKKNAEYVLEEGKIRIEPEKVGIKADKTAVKAALESGKDSYTIDVETDLPDVNAEELQKLLFRDTLGTFSSSFATSSYARASNVILTANRINGKILMPGDVFSYDKTIGRRTAANGYKEAGVYIGNKVESGIGGGICQTSSTLYSAVLYSNLEIVTRTSHSLPVSYVPLGQDATIAEGYIDFRFKNNTDYPVKIVATVNGRRLTCSLVGVKQPNISVELTNTIVSTADPKTERTENAEVPKGYKRILNSGAKGYTVASQRIVKESGKVIKTEKLTRSVYRAAPVEEEVNPEDRDTPTENLKIYTPGMTIPEKVPEEVPEQPEIDEKQTEPEIPPVEDGPQQEEDVPTEAEEDEIVNV